MKTRLFPFLFAVAAFSGCGPHSSQDPHSHTASTQEAHVHDAKLFLTAYGPYREFFAEADPFFIGGTSEILIQITSTDNFKPADSIRIKLRMEIGEQTYTCDEAEKIKPGMFHTHIRPEKQGKGFLTADITDLGPSGKETEHIRIPIEVYPDEHQAHHAAEKLLPSESNTVAFPKMQSYLIDFQTQEAKIENVGMVIATAAQILPTPGAQNEVIAKASGIVSFDDRNIIVGQSVKEGQNLFSLQCGGMMENSIHQYVIKTVNEYEKTSREYERKKALAENKIVSETELLEAKTAYENAAADYEHLRRNFSEDRQIVRAPISGYIKQIDVQNGQYVEAGQPMLTVSQNRKLLLKAELPASYYPYLKDITEANIREMNASHTYSMKELHGKLVSYGKSTDTDNPLIPVIFEIDNSLDAIPGTFVNLYIKTGGETPRLSVPNTAIVEEMGNFFVFVQLTPELFEKRNVRTGATDGFRTEIQEGLRNGERIVSKGAQIIKLSQGTGTLDPHAGHAH